MKSAGVFTADSRSSMAWNAASGIDLTAGTAISANAGGTLSISSSDTGSISSGSSMIIRSVSSDVKVQSGSTLSITSGASMTLSSSSTASFSSSGKLTASATNVETSSSSSSHFLSHGLMSIKSFNNNVELASGGGKAVLFSDGNFGINVGKALAKLHVGGNAVVDGTVTANDYYSPSDRRLKENVTPIKNALEKVLSLNGVTYSWNDKARSLKSKRFDDDKNKTHIGLIAQDVEAVLPELVHTWTAAVATVDSIDDSKNATSVGDAEKQEHLEEFKAVDYSKLSAVIIEAMREQRLMMERLDEQIRMLEEETPK